MMAGTGSPKLARTVTLELYDKGLAEKERKQNIELKNERQDEQPIAFQDLKSCKMH